MGLVNSQNISCTSNSGIFCSFLLLHVTFKRYIKPLLVAVKPGIMWCARRNTIRESITSAFNKLTVC